MSNECATSLLDRVELRWGPVTPVAARIHATLSLDAEDGRWQLSGRVSGPYCAWSSTLPASAVLRPVQHRASEPRRELLAEAVLPDPCYWTPELPMTYRVALELQRDGTPTATAERTLGIRMLVAKKGSFYLAGRRFVPRAAAREVVTDTDLAAWRDAGLAMAVDRVDNELCREATRIGVPLIVTGEADPRLLAAWPCVLLAARDRESVRVVDADDAGAVARTIGGVDVPVVAARRCDRRMTAAQARRACERLQAELASVGDCAGYVVGWSP